MSGMNPQVVRDYLGVFVILSRARDKDSSLRLK